MAWDSILIRWHVSTTHFWTFYQCMESQSQVFFRLRLKSFFFYWISTQSSSSRATILGLPKEIGEHLSELSSWCGTLSMPSSRSSTGCKARIMSAMPRVTCSTGRAGARTQGSGFRVAGTNCIKIGLPGKSIIRDYLFSREYDFLKTFSYWESIFREDLFLNNCLQLIWVLRKEDG